jgi:hypothetical protein
MLTPISALTAHKANPTQATMKRVQQFLDYAATQEPAVLTYRASDMILAIHSDASYLNEENARMFPTQPTKVQFITRHPSSKQSCHPRQKQSSLWFCWGGKSLLFLEAGQVGSSN